MGGSQPARLGVKQRYPKRTLRRVSPMLIVDSFPLRLKPSTQALRTALFSYFFLTQGDCLPSF